MPTTSDFERMLRGAALRVTGPRVAVLRALHDHPHADTDSVISVVREDLGVVSNQAVYDVLRALTAAGLVRRIQPAGSVARYEVRVGDNHHHVVWRHQRCRLRGWLHPVPDGRRRRGLRDRRGRGHLLGPMSRVCRGTFGRIRWVIADMQRPSPEQYSHGSGATRSRATSQQNETARQKEDRRV